MTVLDIAKRNGIFMFQTSHCLQPRDKSVYGPLKTYYNTALNGCERYNLGKNEQQIRNPWLPCQSWHHGISPLDSGPEGFSLTTKMFSLIWSLCAVHGVGQAQPLLQPAACSWSTRGFNLHLCRAALNKNGLHQPRWIYVSCWNSTLTQKPTAQETKKKQNCVKNLDWYTWKVGNLKGSWREER